MNQIVPAAIGVGVTHFGKLPEHDLNSLFAAFSAHGITVRSMRNKANRLEELFVRLVESGKEAA